MKRTAPPSKAGAQAAAAMAAPAWRQFSFFGSTPYQTSSGSSSSSPPLVSQPATISTLHSAPTLGDNGVVLIADLEGRLHLVNEQWEAERSWTAYEGGRVQWVETSSWDYRKGRVIVVTVGDDRSTPFPVLKVWLLTLPLASTAAVAAVSSSIPPPIPEAHLALLRSTLVNPIPSRPSPVSSLALAPTLSHIVVGLADGSVIGWKRVDELIETSLNELEDAAARAAEPPVASSGGRGKAPEKPRPFVVGGMGKLRILWEGNKEPVTNVGVTAPPPSSASSAGLQTLFILTTSQILSLPLPSSTYPHANRFKHATPTVLDEHGAPVGCAKVLRLSVPGEEEGGTQERMVVAREEAIYVYGGEGREGCWAYEGPKSSIVALNYPSAYSAPASSTSRLPTPYLAILTPPQRSTLASHSATIRAHASSSRTNPAPAPPSAPTPAPEEKVGKVTIFDPENKFVAFSKPFGEAVGEGEAGVREVLEAWGAVWVLTEGGKLYRLAEQPLSSSLSQLYQRNLYTLAISLAQSRGLPQNEVAEIYRRYGDHLYSKADYEGAMGCYLKTVGVVQASYVIRKFLDAQRLTHLTSYLQELHSRSLANSDITTLLLNCYTKLGDDAALERFIHSSSSTTSRSSSSDPASPPQEPPFDLETAIRVLRQASYFSYASSLASRYNLHGEYLRIAIEDEGDVQGALAYVRDLAKGEKGQSAADGSEEAKDAMKKWAGVLLAKEPEETTKVLVSICCAPEEAEKPPAVVVDGSGSSVAAVNGSRGRVADLQAGSGSRRGSVANGVPAGYDVPGSSAPQPPAGSSSPALSSSASFTAEPESADSTAADLPSPRLFFPHFVDHPRQFVIFLESLAQRRFGKSVDSFPSASTDAPLPDLRALDNEIADRLPGLDFEDTRTTDEVAVWNTLLELYVSPIPPRDPDHGKDAEEQARLQAKAMKLVRADRGEVPLDATQALLVCTAKGFEDGFIALYEMEGRYEEIVRYYIDASLSSPDSSAASTRLITALRRYGPSLPTLYPLVLRHLTSTAALLSRHQADVLDLLDEVDEKKAMPPIEVVRILSEGGVAGLGVVREYLKKQLTREKEEIDSDLALITSYRTETAKKRAEIHELADPTQPRVFQVTRCAACGGTLEAPMVHFMCKHSYHQRCLGENESQCPNCALTHGVVHEIQRSNAQLAGRHDLFQQEVREADDGFKAMAAAFGRGAMGVAGAAGGET
ncbi:hypothetical protein JCM11251_007644 [Rhodosporidiobolus azoricus]